MMEYKRVRLAFKDNVAVLTLHHPEVLNAISLLMIRELNQAVEEAEDAANGARCLLVTGAGRGFSAGANLSDTESRMGLAGGQIDAGYALTQYYNPFFIRLKTLKMPFVTAVNGPAAGVGMSLAMMGDLVLAARSSYFLQAFRRIGLVPDGGATYLLPRLVGFSRAMELSLLGEKLPAEKALQWGLINRVYDDDELMPRAMELCRELARGPTEALRLIRKAYWESMDNTYEQQLGLEAVLQKQAGQTGDFMEGVAAFLEKRPADFKGK